MQTQTFNLIKNSISDARIMVYASGVEPKESETMAKYVWNMQLCEAFYPSIHALEVVLRNRIHMAFTKGYSAYWFNGKVPFDDWQKGCIRVTKQDLAKQGMSVSPSSIVGELRFGFWSSMFGVGFERTWRGFLKIAFPNLKGSNRTRSFVAANLEPIRKFRNRAFHHNRISHLDLNQIHHQIYTFIGWMCFETTELVRLFDRYPYVIGNGFAECLAKIEAHENDKPEAKDDSPSGSIEEDGGQPVMPLAAD